MARRSRLDALVIDRVDLVDDGANPEAAVMLYKRHAGEDTMTEDPSAPVDDVAKVGRAISAARLARLKAMRDELASLITDAQQGEDMADETNDKAVAKATEPIAPVVPVAPVAPPTDPGDDPVIKARFAEFEKRITDLQATADEAIAKAAAETEKRERADFAKRAEADFAHLPGTPDTKGGLLYTLSKKLTSEEYQAVDVLLKAADAAAKTGAITAEVGKSGHGAAVGSTAFAKMRALATERVSKGEAKTEADAIVAIAQSHPDLYAEHLADMRTSAKS